MMDLATAMCRVNHVIETGWRGALSVDELEAVTILRGSITTLQRRLKDSQDSNDHWLKKFTDLSSLLERAGFVVNVDHDYIAHNGTRFEVESRVPNSELPTLASLRGAFKTEGGA